MVPDVLVVRAVVVLVDPQDAMALDRLRRAHDGQRTRPSVRLVAQRRRQPVDVPPAVLQQPFEGEMPRFSRARRRGPVLERVAVEKQRKRMSTGRSLYRCAEFVYKRCDFLLPEPDEVEDALVADRVVAETGEHRTPLLRRWDFRRCRVGRATPRQPAAERLLCVYVVAGEVFRVGQIVEPLRRALPAHVHAREVARERLAQMPGEPLDLRDGLLPVVAAGHGGHLARLTVVELHAHVGTALQQPWRRVCTDSRNEKDLRVRGYESAARFVDPGICRRIAALAPPSLAAPRRVGGERDKVHIRPGGETHGVAKRVPVRQRQRPLRPVAAHIRHAMREERPVPCRTVVEEEAVEMPLSDLEAGLPVVLHAVATGAHRQAVRHARRLVDEPRTRKPQLLLLVDKVDGDRDVAGILLRKERHVELPDVLKRYRAQARRRPVEESRTDRLAVDEYPRPAGGLAHAHVDRAVRRARHARRADEHQAEA